MSQALIQPQELVSFHADFAAMANASVGAGQTIATSFGQSMSVGGPGLPVTVANGSGAKGSAGVVYIGADTKSFIRTLEMEFKTTSGAAPTIAIGASMGVTMNASAVVHVNVDTTGVVLSLGNATGWTTVIVSPKAVGGMVNDGVTVHTVRVLIDAEKSRCIVQSWDGQTHVFENAGIAALAGPAFFVEPDTESEAVRVKTHTLPASAKQKDLYFQGNPVQSAQIADQQQGPRWKSITFAVSNTSWHQVAITTKQAFSCLLSFGGPGWVNSNLLSIGNVFITSSYVGETTMVNLGGESVNGGYIGYVRAGYNASNFGVIHIRVEQVPASGYITLWMLDLSNSDIRFYAKPSPQSTAPTQKLQSIPVGMGFSIAGKMHFGGLTPISQPSGAAQAALTNSTGGTIGTTLSALSTTDLAAAAATANDNFASLYNQLSAIRTALVNLGLIKGGA